MDKVTGFEVPVHDMVRAEAFYKKAFGWKISKQDKEYARIETAASGRDGLPAERGVVHGAMFKRKPGDKAPLIVITVESLEHALEQVVRAQGTVVTDIQVAGGCGHWAVICDTEGNKFELWEQKP